VGGEPLKIGLILPMSGPFAGYGRQIEDGVRLYLSSTATRFAGRKVELLVKDDTGVAQEISKRVATGAGVGDQRRHPGRFGCSVGLGGRADRHRAKRPMVEMTRHVDCDYEIDYIVRSLDDTASGHGADRELGCQNGIHKVFTVVPTAARPPMRGAVQENLRAAGGESWARYARR